MGTLPARVLGHSLVLALAFGNPFPIAERLTPHFRTQIATDLESCIGS
jgi:hypothetical protein